jgi:hypothetical protein
MRILFSKENEGEGDIVKTILAEIGASSLKYMFNYAEGFGVGTITNRFLKTEAQRVIDSIDTLRKH